jgi:hypothetical protein
MKATRTDPKPENAFEATRFILFFEPNAKADEIVKGAKKHYGITISKQTAQNYRGLITNGKNCSGNSLAPLPAAFRDDEPDLIPAVSRKPVDETAAAEFTGGTFSPPEPETATPQTPVAMSKQPWTETVRETMTALRKVKNFKEKDETFNVQRIEEAFNLVNEVGGIENFKQMCEVG